MPAEKESSIRTRAIASKFGCHNSPRRAPTRGAPTNCLLFSALCPGKGTHKGRPYQLSSLGVWPLKGHPQGVPLPVVFSRRLALRRAPTRGAPTDCLLSAFGPGEGTHKGRPYPIRFALGRAPTRGAPTDRLLAAFCPGEGTHKGCPFRLSSRGVLPWGGHPQGAPLPIVCSRCLALGRAPTRGAPTRFVLPWGGHPQGVPLPDSFCPGKGTHKGCPYPILAASRGFSNLMQLPWHPNESALGLGRFQFVDFSNPARTRWFTGLVFARC